MQNIMEKVKTLSLLTFASICNFKKAYRPETFCSGGLVEINLH